MLVSFYHLLIKLAFTFQLRQKARHVLLLSNSLLHSKPVGLCRLVLVFHTSKITNRILLVGDCRITLRYCLRSHWILLQNNARYFHLELLFFGPNDVGHESLSPKELEIFTTSHNSAVPSNSCMFQVMFFF